MWIQKGQTIQTWTMAFLLWLSNESNSNWRASCHHGEHQWCLPLRVMSYQKCLQGMAQCRLSMPPVSSLCSLTLVRGICTNFLARNSPDTQCMCGLVIWLQRLAGGQASSCQVCTARTRVQIELHQLLLTKRQPFCGSSVMGSSKAE